MTTKQENFCDEYILSKGNATLAAKKAGYAPANAKVTGAKLLKRSDVRESIDARLDELKSAKIADEKEILEFLTASMRGEHTEVIVTNSGKKFELPIRCSDRLKAAEMLAKIFGMFKRSDDDADKVDGAALFVETLQKIWDENPEMQGE